MLICAPLRLASAEEAVARMKHSDRYRPSWSAAVVVQKARVSAMRSFYVSWLYRPCSVTEWSSGAFVGTGKDTPC